MSPTREAPAPSPARERSRDAAWLAAVALVLLAAALRGGFALDDRELLGDNPVISGAAPWWTAFTRDYFGFLGGTGQWRPLSALSLRLDRSLFGDAATPYHLVNAGLHLAAVALALRWGRALAIPPGVLRAGLTLFAVHPLLADSVVWIAGRTTLLATLAPLALGAWLLPRVAAGRSRAPEVAWVSGLATLLGLLAKEEAVIWVPTLALAVAGAAPSRGRALLGSAALGAGLATLLVLAARALALGELLPTVSTPALGSAGPGERLVVGGNALLEAARLVVLPLDHPPRFRAARLLELHTPPGPVLAGLLGWGLLLAPVAGGLLALRRGASGATAGSALLAALALWPLTQVLPLGEVLAPRFLHLPLLLAAPAIGVLLERLAGRRLGVATALIVVVLGALLVQRAAVYASPASWHGRMLVHHPDDAPTWNALGLLHEEAGEVAEAEAAWRQALELDPGYSKPWSNLGRVQLERGELEAAERSLVGAVDAGPRNAVARVNLAALLSRRGRLEEAVARYREATELAPGLSPAWRGLGLALSRLERVDEARAALQQALALDPGDRRAQTLLERLGGPAAVEGATGQ